MSSSSSSRDFWLFNTMLVENEYGGEGTGLLVFRPNKTESNEGKVFLITNKHVLNPDPEKKRSSNKGNITHKHTLPATWKFFSSVNDITTQNKVITFTLIKSYLVRCC